MLEGLWIVQYEGMKGNGGGVAVFMKGHILGGDSGYLYYGSYKHSGNEVRAHIRVENFLPEVQSVIGAVGELVLVVDGKIEGDVINGSGRLANGEAVGIAVKLTKRMALPE